MRFNCPGIRAFERVPCCMCERAKSWLLKACFLAVTKGVLVRAAWKNGKLFSRQAGYCFDRAALKTDTPQFPMNE